MSPQLKTVGIIVKNMSATLAFYRVLGLPIPDHDESELNLDFETESGLVLGFLAEAVAQKVDPTYQPADGGRLNLQFECARPAEVDATHARLEQAGYQTHTPPWDAFWGQRFARILDPDNRVINLYATL